MPSGIRFCICSRITVVVWRKTANPFCYCDSRSTMLLFRYYLAYSRVFDFDLLSQNGHLQACLIPTNHTQNSANMDKIVVLALSSSVLNRRRRAPFRMFGGKSESNALMLHLWKTPLFLYTDHLRKQPMLSSLIKQRRYAALSQLLMPGSYLI